MISEALHCISDDLNLCLRATHIFQEELEDWGEDLGEEVQEEDYFDNILFLLRTGRDVHESPRFRCVCGLSFPRKGNLDRHVLKSCKGKR